MLEHRRMAIQLDFICPLPAALITLDQTATRPGYNPFYYN